MSLSAIQDTGTGGLRACIIRSTNRPTHRVYAVIKKEGLEKGTWLEIGAAWPHRDGKGYGVKLDFIPRSPDAELVIRAIEPKPAAAGAG
jgi:hypothetical protein